MKLGIKLIVGLFILGVITALIQLWFAPWQPEFFVKTEMTIGALLLIVLVLCFVAKEHHDNKITRSGEHLD
jgi:hypothetical protein